MRDRTKEKAIYPGFHQDGHGITVLGRIVLDAWVFGLLPRDEDCAGWDMARIQQLMPARAPCRALRLGHRARAGAGLEPGARR